MVETICGKYNLNGIIGRGKFGIVMKATDKANKEFAVKFASSELFCLRHEAMILNYLNTKKCKNIPLIHWYGLHSKIPCIVIPYYKCSLSNINISNLSLMNQMLTIIKNVHDLFVIHRDIKPENFMLNHRDEVVLIDFGLATFSEDVDNELENKKVEKVEKEITGNIIFASPNIHCVKKARKIDDVISIAYVYIYLCNECNLPWMQLEDNNCKIENIYDLKKIENIECIVDKTSKFMSFLRRLYNGILTYNV